MNKCKGERHGAYRFLMFCVCLTMVWVLLLAGADAAYADIATGTSGTCSWVIDDNGVLTISPTDGVSGTLKSYMPGYPQCPWSSYGTRIKKVVVNPGVSAAAGCYRLFDNLTACTEMDLSNFNTSNVTDMSSMFNDCRSLTSLDLSGFDTSKVTSMGAMFYNCYGLTSLDVSGFDTSNVTSMGSMFYGCSSLPSLDVSGFDTSNVTSMDSMFYGCRSLPSLDVSGFDTSNVTSMRYMFYSCSSLPSLDLSGFDTSNVTSMDAMFYYCSSLASLDVSGFDTSNVTNMSNMFQGCSQLATLDVSGFDTNKVTNMSNMFSGCSSLPSLDVSGFDTSNVTNMSNMFYGCRSLPSLDVSGFDTSKVTSMYYMFYNCNSLTSLDVSGFDTSNVTTMYQIFYYCRSLTSLDLSGFDTSKVTNMSSMFYNCSKLTSLDVSGFDTSKVTDMSNMFSGCYILSEIDLGEHFSFKGKNITSTSKMALLPAQPSATTTGKWIREDETYGPFTPAQLRDNYKSNAVQWAGKWVWELKDGMCYVEFDANGGFVTGTSRITANKSDQAHITLPSETEVTREGYALKYWTLAQADPGSGYAPGTEAIIDTTGALTTKLYAQWRTETRIQYRVEHYQQNVDSATYTLVETENKRGEHFYDDPADTYSESVSPTPKTYENFYTPETQTRVLSKENENLFQYYYDRQTYYISFDGNGADYGHMETTRLLCGIPTALPENAFAKDQAFFNGWSESQDGTGARYADMAEVMNIAEPETTKILYAQWISLDQASGATEGKIIVEAKAGQTIIIPNLPAGTTYTIQEIQVPPGWTKIQEENSTGTITSNTKSKASIKNRYEAAGFVSITAQKSLSNGNLADGMFSFELLDNSNTVVASAVNGSPDAATGVAQVRFPDVEIKAAGTYTYKIREVNTGDDRYNYDDHTETVTVRATDNGDGTLSTTVTYDANGPLFTNSIKEIPGGDIAFTKTTINQTQANQNQTFDFTVNVYDETDSLVANSFDAVLTAATARFEQSGYSVAGVKYSHTQNISDDGTKNSNYGSNWTNANITGTDRGDTSKAHVVTIPGASKLEVTIKYGGESASWDWACMWVGSYPNYTAANNYSSSLTNKLGGGNATSASNTKTYTVEGDTVTFAFKSDGGGYGDGYGYYAVITGYEELTGYINTQSFSYTPGSTIAVANGDVVTISNLPQGYRYEIQEASAPGWELASSSNTTGVVPSGETAPTASFTNVYSAEGSLQITANKVLNGDTLYDDMYQFTLKDVNGQTISQAFAKADGTITFNAIDYTLADDGQTYVYFINEEPGEDPLITYDPSVKEVSVYVHDNGQGELVTDVTYPASGMTFVNEKLSNVNLTVSKTVAGNMGSRDKYFNFTLTLTNEDNSPYADDIDVPDGASAWTKTGAGVYTFKLKHTDSFSLELPSGTKYRIEETPEDYIARVSITQGSEKLQNNAQTAIATGTLDATAGDTLVEYKNTRLSIVPTGIEDIYNLATYVSMIGAGILALLLLLSKKQKEE